MADPEPRLNLYESYPKDGELHYLFRKKLTHSDLWLGLLLVGKRSREHLLELKMSSASVKIYTPASANNSVSFQRHGRESTVQLSKIGWTEIATSNGFVEDDEIDCWRIIIRLMINKGRLLMVE
ncbi:hypothetical protein SADUNF_Sadunf05G0017600 [Salix dunnii]|uniref:Uncharacterized protein n=1 Tax=Salix dunnii TaxID=1413687 RepID=A0A835MWL4_9ROSI|nr:hypothetical protein SADUNF_Sadunf05G0017600 [Salix dunnii]